MTGTWLRERRDALLDEALTAVTAPLLVAGLSLVVHLPLGVVTGLGGFAAGVAASHIKKILSVGETRFSNQLETSLRSREFC